MQIVYQNLYLSLFDYFVELKVKQPKQKGLTNAIEATLTQQEKVMKKNVKRQAYGNKTNERSKTQQEKPSKSEFVKCKQKA